MRVRLSPLSKTDLAEIRRFIARDNPTAAAKVVNSIRMVLRNVIARYPLVGTSCEELLPGLRSFPVGSYVVFYDIIDGREIEIVRVLHGARDAGAIFRS